MVFAAISAASFSLLSVSYTVSAGFATAWRPFQPRRRSALDTTHTELRLMAAAAIMGFRVMPKAGYSTPAATGMPTVL